MKVSCIQLNMRFCDADFNYTRAVQLIEETVRREQSDVLVLPETWSTGYYPVKNLKGYCDKDGSRIKQELGSLAKKLSVNIVGGSIANIKNGKIYNTAYVFDRRGNTAAEYDKTHLFTPMNEDKFFEYGNHISTFKIDNINCGIIICYDLRFPELVRTLSLKGIEMLFIVSQWPSERIEHLKLLSQARAVENQIFAVVCNSCGENENIKFGGNSLIADPLGNILAKADEKESVITAECDFSIIADIRKSMNVFNDRNTHLYEL